MTPKFLFNSGQNYRLLYGLWFPSLPVKTHHLFPPKWHWFMRAHCPLVLPQASTLPVNKPGNSGSSGWITCSAVFHNCSWSRAENFARGAIWLRGYVRRQILNVYSGRHFSWKTSRYCSAATTQASDLGSLYNCYSYSLDSFTMVTSTQVLLHFSVLTKKEFVTVVTISLSTPMLTCFAYLLIRRKQS